MKQIACWLIDWKYITALSVFAILVCSLCLVVYNYFFHPIAHFKGPFIAAISPIWLIRSTSGHRLNNDIEGLHRKYGPVVRIGPNELSFATEEALKDIHNPVPTAGHFTKKGTIEELVGKLTWAAPNLLTTYEKAAHKRLRTALQPAFTAKALLEQEEITQYHVNAAADKLAKAEPHQPINVTDIFGRMMWGIVGDLAFGEPLSIEQLEQYEKMKSVYGKGAPLLELSQFLYEIPLFGPLVKIPVIMVRKIFGAPKKVLGMSRLRGYMRRQDGRKDFLTAVLGAKEQANLTSAEVLSNMALLSMVGYDTSTATISAIFYHLLRHPEYYKRLQAELHKPYTSADSITCAGLLKLPLLNACIQESLRLLPPINGRGSHRISPGANIGGFWVPKGTNVSADIWTIHRDPACWASAAEYRPERWLGDYNGPGTPFEHDVRSSWRPFLVGPRVCIGREMALQSIRLAVAKIVYLYDFTMANHDFVWERDAGSDYVWHHFDILARVTKAQVAAQL